MSVITIPPDALVVLVGIAGSGKSTFAARHFTPTEVLSSDAMRALVADDPTDQSATGDAFEILHAVVARRLARGRLTVVDATNVQAWAREPLLEAAQRHQRPAVAVVLALPLEVCLARNAARTTGPVPAAAVQRQDGWLRMGLRGLAAEGFSAVDLIETPDALDAAEVRRTQRNVPKERRPTL